MADHATVLDVPDSDVEDLRSRLLATRWATPWPVTGWEAGTDQTELRRLVDHWATGYDWRAQEERINALPHQVAEVDGTLVHHLRFDAEAGDHPPLLLANGWPSTFLELVELAERLSTPSRFGGSPDDAFTVVVPSLPGYGLSPQRPRVDGPGTHELWHRLMHDVVGAERYGAHGSDLGAHEVSLLAQTHPESVVGLHLLHVADPPVVDPATLDADEVAYLDAHRAFDDERGYSHEQGTKPLTLAQGLTDSPSGLLAWIVEKYRSWSDCGGDLGSRFSDDFLLTQASLYWFTGAASTGFRPYYERHQGLVPAVERVTVPTAVSVFPVDIGAPPPRRWAERVYDVARWTEMPRGGHFAAHEEPALLAADITAFFGQLARA